MPVAGVPACRPSRLSDPLVIEARQTQDMTAPRKSDEFINTVIECDRKFVDEEEQGSLAAAHVADE